MLLVINMIDYTSEIYPARVVLDQPLRVPLLLFSFSAKHNLYVFISARIVFKMA
jgi:hypothetical protein